MPSTTLIPHVPVRGDVICTAPAPSSSSTLHSRVHRVLRLCVVVCLLCWTLSAAVTGVAAAPTDQEKENGEDPAEWRTTLDYTAPTIPLAEIYFGRFNPHITAPQTNLRAHVGSPVKTTLEALSAEKHPVIRLADRMHEEAAQKGGFCFVSIGNWGGPAPHNERQTKVMKLLRHLVRHGVRVNADTGDYVGPEVELGEASPYGARTATGVAKGAGEKQSTSTLNVNFVLSAGANFYAAGVQDAYDQQFFSTFEGFYTDEGEEGDVEAEAATGNDLEKGGEPHGKERNAVPDLYTSLHQMTSIPWLISLGLEDYLGDVRALQHYTFDAPTHTGRHRHQWTQSLLHPDVFRQQPRKPDANAEELNATATRLRRVLGQYARKLRTSHGVTGRWYLPHFYYSLRVSEDTVVISIDTTMMYLCEAAQAGFARPHGITMRPSEVECTQQRRMIRQWLREEYFDVPFKIVVGHHPVEANGPHATPRWFTDFLQPLLRETCVSLYVNAYNGYLQVSRDALQFYVNNGGGGGKNDGVVDTPSWTDALSVFQEAQVGGLVVHCKHGNQLTSHVLSEDGELRFSFHSERELLDECMVEARTHFLAQFGDPERNKYIYYHPSYGIVVIRRLSSLAHHVKALRYGAFVMCLIAALLLAHFQLVLSDTRRAGDDRCTGLFHRCWGSALCRVLRRLLLSTRVGVAVISAAAVEKANREEDRDYDALDDGVRRDMLGERRDDAPRGSSAAKRAGGGGGGGLGQAANDPRARRLRMAEAVLIVVCIATAMALAVAAALART